MSSVQDLSNILQLFKIKARCIDHKKIRNVSLYDLIFEPGTRINSVNKYGDEISLAMKAHTKPIVRVIPELGIVRLEVVDEAPHKISFFDEFKKLPSPKGELPMYLGSSVNGEDMWMDMAKNPHLLIAGCTGSGKSTLLQVILANSIALNTRIFLVDTKNVDFAKYKDFSNISIANNFNDSLKFIDFLINEMEMRYRKINKGNHPKSSDSILFIIDELSDLMLQDQNKVFHTKLCQLAQKSRAAKIHCVLATQRPSVNILSGAIKANFPARISCQVASSIDSRVILDAPGADLLAGNGDAIIKNYNNNYKRFQVAYVTPEEVSLKYGN